MGYRQTEIVVDLSEMGDGAFVRMRNPLLEPLDRASLTTPRTPEGDIDMVAIHDRAAQKTAGLILEWVVWDKDTGDVLPLPSDDPTVLDRVPAYVMNRLGEEFVSAMRPTKPEKGDETSEKVVPLTKATNTSST